MTCSPAKINFTELEKNILCELITKYQCIVEAKSNDARSVQMKREVWVDLTRDFNSKPGVNKRSSKQLRKCWENMKSRAKKSKSRVSQTKKFDHSKLPTLVPLPLSAADAVCSADEQLKPVQTSCKQEAADVTSALSECVKSENSIMLPHSEQNSFIQPEQQRPSADEMSSTFSPEMLMGNCWPEGATAFVPIPMNRLCRSLTSLPSDCTSATQLEILKMHQAEHEVQMNILRRQIEMQEQEHQARMELVKQHKRVLDLQEKVFGLQLLYMQQFDIQSSSENIPPAKVVENT